MSHSEIAETQLGKWNVFKDGKLEELHLELVRSAAGSKLRWRSPGTLHQLLHTELGLRTNAALAGQGGWVRANSVDVCGSSNTFLLG